MAKRKVLSVFSLLTLFGLGLAIFSLSQFGSLTGRVVDDTYHEELFMGNDYEFQFLPRFFDVRDEVLYIEGNLNEIAGKDHQLQIVGYVYDSNGEIAATFSKEFFLESNSNLNVKLSTRAGDARLGQALLYVEDEFTSIKISKEFYSSRGITGSAIDNSTQDNSGNGFPLLIGIVVFISAVLFVVSQVKQQRKQDRLENLFSNKTHRKYIDLDVR